MHRFEKLQSYFIIPTAIVLNRTMLTISGQNVHCYSPFLQKPLSECNIVLLVLHFYFSSLVVHFAIQLKRKKSLTKNKQINKMEHEFYNITTNGLMLLNKNKCAFVLSLCYNAKSSVIYFYVIHFWRLFYLFI